MLNKSWPILADYMYVLECPNKTVINFSKFEVGTSQLLSLLDRQGHTSREEGKLLEHQTVCKQQLLVVKVKM